MAGEEDMMKRFQVNYPTSLDKSIYWSGLEECKIGQRTAIATLV